MVLINDLYRAFPRMLVSRSLSGKRPLNLHLAQPLLALTLLVRTPKQSPRERVSTSSI